MIKTAISALSAAFVLTSASAFAADYNGAKAVCADAISIQAGKTLDGAKAKLVRARDGATMRVTVEVAYADGTGATGECRVRRGEVTSVELKS